MSSKSVGLEKNTKRYQKLVENLPVGVLIIKEGLIDYANPHALQMLGVKKNMLAKIYQM